MPKAAAADSSEKLQIAILTFFMTAGGFLILTLVFSLYLNSRMETRMTQAERTYESLTSLLLDEDMRRLRQQDKMSQEKENTHPLEEIISRNLSTYGIEYREFRTAKRTPTKGQEGIIEVSQQINLKPAPMRPILQFVATVQDAKKSIRVSSLDLNRNKRAGPDADSWTASVAFVDYEPKSSQ